MKLSLLLPATVAALALAGAASAQEWYGQLNVGTSLNGQTDVDATLTDGATTIADSAKFDLENSLLFSGGFGRDNGRFRIEAEGLYTESDVDNAVLSDGTNTEDLGDVSVTQAAIMLNVLVDLGSSERFQPYVGAGLGFGATRFEAPDIDEDDAKTGLAWQVKAGVAIRATDRLTWDIGYRYLRSPDFDVSYSEPGFSYTIDTETSTHALTVGLRFGF